MAKQICAGCPVRGDCLEHALASRELAFGIWGGLTAAERRALVRSRTAAA
jgi:WhiB family redox-sensing transcriptional regulator